MFVICRRTKYPSLRVLSILYIQGTYNVRASAPKHIVTFTEYLSEALVFDSYDEARSKSEEWGVFDPFHHIVEYDFALIESVLCS